MGSTCARKNGASAPSGLNLIVLLEEKLHPNWEISAADRRDRETAVKTCANHFAISAPVVALSSGLVSADIYAWLVLAGVILLGSKLLWWATEHAWGKYS
jgi:hypothetical protein